MLIGALVFGYIIGAVGNVVQQRSAKENEFFTSMQNLDGFMQEQRLPAELQNEIKTYDTPPSCTCPIASAFEAAKPRVPNRPGLLGACRYVQHLKLSFDMTTYQHYTTLLSPGLRAKVRLEPTP